MNHSNSIKQASGASSSVAEDTYAKRTKPALWTLVFTDLVDSTKLVERIGDARASEIFSHHDRLARDLMKRWEGLEIDRTDGFFLVFRRPVQALGFALSYHLALEQVTEVYKETVTTRVGLHLGEIELHRNSPERIAQGQKPLEAVGRAIRLTENLMEMASARQTLLTRPVLELGLAGARETPFSDKPFQWVSHGDYLLSRNTPPLEVCELGNTEHAPFTAPIQKSSLGDTGVTTLPWQPKEGAEIPGRKNWALHDRLRKSKTLSEWVAVHKKTGDRRVFKLTSDTDQLKLLKREVAVYRLLKEELDDRADINPINDWNFERPPYFIEIAYSESGYLHEWAESQGGLKAIPLDLRLELVAQIAETLDAAHSVSVLHKCLSPKSIQIQVDRKGKPHARLTNFGFGAISRPERLKDVGVSTAQMKIPTLFNAQLGVSDLALYLAPEVQKGHTATLQSDIYSLGVLLYQLSVGSFEISVTGYWQENMDDPLLRNLISDLVDANPAKRQARPLWVADQLRTLEARRLEMHETQLAEDRAKQVAESELQRALGRGNRYKWFAFALAALLLLSLLGLGLVLVDRGSLKNQLEQQRTSDTAAPGVDDAAPTR
ncbi:Protein kinase [Sulfidibacter corallicola]|uniref:Protein kinase n=1 Tax=Sulfidibacter corallicola TaxID=2818388 RepID=A0A8A4TG45_SULCO|nr:protein kinase [Sulfidibacter corallicola]QTD48896.1 protein kinase [Sulfidibacter corallicola]